jgi:hypothetical protein
MFMHNKSPTHIVLVALLLPLKLHRLAAAAAGACPVGALES